MNMRMGNKRATGSGHMILAGLCLACLVNWAIPSVAQTDLKSLDDDAIIEQLHREEYKAEFDRRMRVADPIKRIELAKKRTKQPRQREFPAAYTDDELLEQATHREDTMASTEALEELRVRYAEADTQKIAVMEGRLRTAFATLGYPESAGRLKDPIYHEETDALRGLSSAVAACLPEERALDVLWDVHIKPRPKGGIGRFLSHLSGAPFTGQATVDRLLALRHILKTEYTTHAAYADAGEHEQVGTGLTALLAQCGQPGFEALKAMDWDSPVGIQTMGYVGTDESRKLLFDLYEQAEPSHIVRRLDIIAALASNLRSATDNTLRDFVRTELTEILLRDLYGSLTQFDSAVQIAADTRDPYFIAPLLKLREDLTPSRIPAPAHEFARKANELNYRSLEKTLEKSITTLQKIEANTK